MKTKLQGLFDFVILGNASVSRGFTFDNNYLKFLGTGYYMAYFFFNQRKAALESKKFAIKAEFELTRRVWNLLDTRGIKHLLKGLLAGLHSIKYRKKLYVKKTKKPLTIEYIRTLIEQVQKGRTFSFQNNNKLDNSDHYLNISTSSIVYDCIENKEKISKEEFDKLPPIVEAVIDKVKLSKTIFLF